MPGLIAAAQRVETTLLVRLVTHHLQFVKIHRLILRCVGQPKEAILPQQ